VIALLRIEQEHGLRTDNHTRRRSGIALSTLFRRVPAPRLAAPHTELEMREGSAAGGLVSLPATR